MKSSVKWYQPFIIIALALIGACITANLISFNIIYDSPAYYNEYVLEPSSGNVVGIDENLTLYGDKAAETSTIIPGEKIFFHHNSYFLIWGYAFSVLVAISFAFILPVLGSIVNIHREIGLNLWYIIKGTIPTIGLIWVTIWIVRSGVGIGDYYLTFPQVMESFHVLLNHSEQTVTTISILAAIGAGLACVGMFVVNSTMTKIDTTMPLKEQERKFNVLVRLLNFFFLIVAIIVSGTILASVFLREALLQALHAPAELIAPTDFLYVHGFIFSLILALIYVPLFLQLKRKGNELLEHASDAASNMSDDTTVQLSDTFQMNFGKYQTTKTIITIMAPILTSLLTKALEF